MRSLTPILTSSTIWTGWARSAAASTSRVPIPILSTAPSPSPSVTPSASSATTVSRRKGCCCAWCPSPSLRRDGTFPVRSMTVPSFPSSTAQAVISSRAALLKTMIFWNSTAPVTRLTTPGSKHCVKPSSAVPAALKCSIPWERPVWSLTRRSSPPETGPS